MYMGDVVTKAHGKNHRGHGNLNATMDVRTFKAEQVKKQTHQSYNKRKNDVEKVWTCDENIV